MKEQVAAAEQGIEKRPKATLILGVGRTPFTFLPNSGAATLSPRRAATC